MAQFVDRKNGAVLIRVSIGTANGRSVTRSFVYHPIESSPRKRRAELERVASDFRQRCIAESHLPGASMSFSSAVSSWQDSYASQNISQHTLEKYLAVLRFWWSHLNSRKLSSITAVELQSVIDSASADHLPTSVADIFKPVRAIFGYCYRLGIIQENPADRVRLPRLSDQDEPRFWTDDQLRLFLSMLSADLFVTRIDRQIPYSVPIFWKAFFVLAIYSGARRSELVALLWGDIDASAGVIHIHAAATIYGHEQHIKAPKTLAGTRSISLPGVVFDVLEDHRQDLIRRRYSVSGRFPVFPQESGSAMHLTTPTRKFSKLVRIVNENLPADQRLPVISLHGLRHSSASLLVSSGMDVLTVARRLGHSRISHTLDIYSHAYDKRDATAADLLATVLDNGEDSDD